MALRRISSELKDLQEGTVNSCVNIIAVNIVHNIIVAEDNFYEWKFTIFPPHAPNNIASFDVEIKLPGI
jgi:hypothetical protein